jgi:hypothetical protein
MQDENEKAVRTLFEQWWNDKCANMPILDYGYETMAQDIAYHAFKAALQSQVSNTDGWVMVPVEPDIEFLELFVCSGLYAANKPNDELVEKARARWRRLLSAAPKAPQQVSNTLQDGAIPPELDVRNIMLRVVPGLDGMGEEVFARSVDDVVRELSLLGSQLEDYELGIRKSPDTPTATEAQEFEAYALELADKPLDGASQESAPEQEEVAFDDWWDKQGNWAEVNAASDDYAKAKLAWVAAQTTSTAIAAMVIQKALNKVEAKVHLYDGQMEGADHDDFIRNEWAAGAMRQLLKELRIVLTPAAAEAGLEALMMDKRVLDYLEQQGQGFKLSLDWDAAYDGEQNYSLSVNRGGVNDPEAIKVGEGKSLRAIVRRVLDEKGE